MQSSSYHQAKDTITLRRIQLSPTKRSESLSASRPLEKAHRVLAKLVSSFNHHGDGFASTDAEGGDPLSLAEIAKGVNQRS
jgi:hypothetical protein